MKVKTADVVILSYCKDIEYFKLNVACINSLIESEDEIEFRIVVVESNKNWLREPFRYDMNNVHVIVPENDFNFNKFLNTGIAAGESELVILANNDLIFHRGWLSEILAIRNLRGDILSFCPFDRKSIYLKWEKFKTNAYIIGYRVPIEFVGWCVVLERSVFGVIGPLDETFDLYFQDNDFARTLQHHGVLHALVPNSFVEHLGGRTTGIVDASKTKKYEIDKLKFETKWPPVRKSISHFRIRRLIRSIIFSVRQRLLRKS